MKKSHLLGAVLAVLITITSLPANAAFVSGSIEFDLSTASISSGAEVDANVLSANSIMTPVSLNMNDTYSFTVNFTGGSRVVLVDNNSGNWEDNGNDREVVQVVLFDATQDVTTDTQVLFTGVSGDLLTNPHSNMPLCFNCVALTNAFDNLTNTSFSFTGMQISGTITTPVSGIFSVATLLVGAGNVSIIPVPSALYLFGTGLLGLIGVARKRAA